MAKTEKTAGGSAHDETPMKRTWWRRKRVWISALVLVLLVVIGVVVGAVYGVRNSKNEYVCFQKLLEHMLKYNPGICRATTKDCPPLKVVLQQLPYPQQDTLHTQIRLPAQFDPHTLHPSHRHRRNPY